MSRTRVRKHSRAVSRQDWRRWAVPGGGEGGGLLEVWNKIDRLEGEARVRLRNQAERQAAPHCPVLVSARTGEGLEGLAAEIERGAAPPRGGPRLLFPAAPGAALGLADP